MLTDVCQIISKQVTELSLCKRYLANVSKLTWSIQDKKSMSNVCARLYGEP